LAEYEPVKTSKKWSRGRRAGIALVVAAIAAAALSAVPRVAGHGGTADIIPPSIASGADQ
jgi:hypothetical protein